MCPNVQKGTPLREAILTRSTSPDVDLMKTRRVYCTRLKDSRFGFQWKETSWWKSREPLHSEVVPTTLPCPSRRFVRHFVFFRHRRDSFFWLGHRQPNNKGLVLFETVSKIWDYPLSTSKANKTFSYQRHQNVPRFTKKENYTITSRLPILLSLLILRKRQRSADKKCLP